MEPSTSSSNGGGGGTSELFICFTSRISSMKKLTSSNSGNSKSLLSPARSSQISLSSSLSRRLRSSGSLRGGASPMFPAGKKRSGAAAFENPEPSSPKVTCIGQVRVKSKAKKKNKSQHHQSNNAAVARCRRSLSGEASFRRSEREKSSGRRWVTMCDALRLSCLVPSCRSSKKKEEGRSCGAVLARWLVADGKGGRREIELVMAAEDRSEKRMTKQRELEREEEEDVRSEEERDREAAVMVVERSGSLKRRVLEGIEFREFAADRDDIGGGDQKARVSLCVPPKNALLLMRCRSDPVKMAALASRFYDCDDDDDDEIINRSSINNDVQDEEEETDEDSEVEEEQDLVKEEPTNMLVVEEEEEEPVLVKEEEEKGENETETIKEKEEEMADEMQAVIIVDESSTDQPNAVLEEDSEEEENMFRLLYEEEEKEEEDMVVVEAEEVKEDEELERDSAEEYSTAAPEKEERESGGLPDCLLLMMCEPKLSMEVSKETWIRTTDFVRWLPERRRNNKKPITKAALPPKPPSTVLLQPPRSSCSSVAAAGAKPYEPFLTRCKSEPRKSPVTVQPLEPFWKAGKHDSGHHRASAGIGV